MVHVEQDLNLYLVDNLMEQVLVELEPLVKVIMVEMVVEALLNTVVVAVVKVLKVAMAFPNEPMRAPGTRRQRHPADSQSAAAVAGPPTHALLARRKSLRLSFDANRKGTRTEVR